MFYWAPVRWNFEKYTKDITIGITSRFGSVAVAQDSINWTAGNGHKRTSEDRAFQESLPFLAIG